MNSDKTVLQKILYELSLSESFADCIHEMIGDGALKIYPCYETSKRKDVALRFFINNSEGNQEQEEDSINKSSTPLIDLLEFSIDCGSESCDVAARKVIEGLEGVIAELKAKYIKG